MCFTCLVSQKTRRRLAGADKSQHYYSHLTRRGPAPPASVVQYQKRKGLTNFLREVPVCGGLVASPAPAAPLFRERSEGFRASHSARAQRDVPVALCSELVYVCHLDHSSIFLDHYGALLVYI
jgi:hypothetical protein